MTEIERKILEDFNKGKISRDDFLNRFPIDLKKDKEYVIAEIRKAIDSKDTNELNLSIDLIWFSGDFERYTDILNELLINPNHTQHQIITKTIQDDIKSPKSIPYIRKALESNFDYLEYTCSVSDAIAKWFSWALASIGTKEAIDLIKEYSNSSDEGIRNEMIYRLKRIETKNNGT